LKRAVDFAENASLQASCKLALAEPRCSVTTSSSAAAPHPPTRNHLLAALQGESIRRLLPHLEPMSLPLGRVLYEPRDDLAYVLFPTEGIVSKLYVTADGASTEIALVGSEGVVGLTQLLSGRGMPDRAVVQSAGHAYRLAVEVLRQEFERGGDLQRLLLRFIQALMTQIAQTAVCNRLHTLEQQLCRWLLLSLDRLSSNNVHMTQELIANMLGVRREGVTEAAGRLQDDGLISYHRGRITVNDRARLERRACECYSVVKRESDRLMQVGGDPERT
jgi:CRP-like cAMP-binding protein